MSKLATATLVSVLSLAMGPAFAQEAPIVSVEGDVMVSSGGEFVTASDGQEVAPGDSIMVQEDSAVTLSYSNGCTQTFTEPGTYAVGAECVPPPAGTYDGQQFASNAGTTAAIVGGVVLVTAAIIESNLDGDPVPPISP